MSIFGYVIALVVLFTVLQCKVQAEDKCFVFGSLTRVWLSRQDKDHKMHYEEQESGIVQKAVESSNRTDHNSAVHACDPNEKYVYLSVLVLMEYKDDPYPEHDPHAQKEYIYKKIRYAVNFWNKVNNELKGMKNPSVQIRVVGMVIPVDRFAYSILQHRYLTWAPIVSNGFFLKIYSSLTQQLYEWNQATNNFFNANNFNVIATMTNFDPAGLFERSWSYQFDNCEGKLTHLPRASGLMFWDDENYGLQRAVGEVAHLLGRQYVGNSAKATAATFTKDDFDRMRNTLGRLSCWKEPNENWPPGKPIPAIV